MNWTPEQRSILDHGLDHHAVVRASPGAGKTTTLVGRVERLVARGVDPAAVRVVMFNKAIQEVFVSRLAAIGVHGIRVSTFDALGLEVLRVADRERLLSKPLRVVAGGTVDWSRVIYRYHLDDFDSAEEIASAVTFWKAHLVSPKRAAFPSNPALVRAYERFESMRGEHEELLVAFEDMVYTAVGVLGRHPRLLGRVDHVLVDEFQDVNPARVELVRRLMHAGTTVMAVGDEDQGINEWCGAHPRFLTDFRGVFPNLPSHDYLLSRSFRFGPDLAGAANNLIRQNESRSGGAVVGGGAAAGAVTVVADAGATVKALLARGVCPPEIAVLYRGRTQAAAVMAALAIEAIPMRTDDLDILRRGRGPELALAYLRHSVSDDPVRFEEVWPIVFAPDRYVQKEAFAKQVQRVGARGLKTLLRDRREAELAGQSRRAVASLSDLARVLQTMAAAATAAAALDRLLEEVDFEEQLRARLRSEKDQDAAIAGFHGMHALLRGLGVAPAQAAEALAELDATAGRPPDACVWVSTIHKAKGMEWRHVVLPGLIEGACPAEQRGAVAGTTDEPGGVPQSPWMEQERRVFYVGFTRAIEAVWLHAPGDAPSRFVEEAGGRTEAGVRAAAAVRGEAGARSMVPRPKSTIQAMIGAVTRLGALEPTSAGEPWRPDDDDALAAAWDAGDGLAELAERLGRSTSGVAGRLVRIGVVESREEARRRP